MERIGIARAFGDEPVRCEVLAVEPHYQVHFTGATISCGWPRGCLFVWNAQAYCELKTAHEKAGRRPSPELTTLWNQQTPYPR
jgi:hypothetical protein